MKLPEIQPTLFTTRLILRPFALGDAPEFQKLVSAWEVACAVVGRSTAFHKRWWAVEQHLVTGLWNNVDTMRRP